VSEVPSILDAATLARLRADARAHRSPFTDPALIRDAAEVLGRAGAQWLTLAVGRPAGHWQRLSNEELHVAVQAARLDHAHLTAAREAHRATYEEDRRRRAAEGATLRRAAVDAWAALRAAQPVPVAVRHNWTSRHLDGYEQGGDHIVVLAALVVGRLHRAAGDPLCWTPSRARELRHVDGAAGDESRLPDCKACLKTAARVAAG
jgi:hypothetical protein